MLLFIIIFFAMLIVVGVTAVVGFSIYLNRRAKSLDAKNQKQFADAPPYRSLFEPNDEEIRAFEREAQLKVEVEPKEVEPKVSAAKVRQVSNFESTWLAQPNKQNTIEFLRLAAMSESAEIFARAAETVIKARQNERTDGLSKKDLADLLDSHLRILPQQERTSGAIFWLREKIKNLREKSE